MNFLFNLKLVIVLIVLENFFYKYYIGVNYFTELHKGKIKKGKLAIAFFLLLSSSYSFLVLFKWIYEKYFDNDVASLIFLILAAYFSIYLYERVLGRLEHRLYMSVNIFLLISIIETKFDNHISKILAIIFIPFFYYLNLVILEPLLKSLLYKKRSVYVNDGAIVIIVIALIGLLLSAFDGI